MSPSESILPDLTKRDEPIFTGLAAVKVMLRSVEAHLATGFAKWDFDEATFDCSAASFENPDHVAIVIHNYRWRLGLAEGEPKYDDLEKRLAAGPVITGPTITLEGDANGAPASRPQFICEEILGQV